MTSTNTTETVFHVYKSSMQSHRTITPKGKNVIVLDYKVITKDPEVIEFLDSEIKAGSTYFSKQGTMTSEDLDPMAALKKKIIADFKAEEAEKEKTANSQNKADAPVTQLPDSETSPADQAGKKLGAATTSMLANLKAKSNSQ